MKSIHGWPVIANPNSTLLKLFPIPGADRKMRLRKDVGPYLVAFASEYNTKIARIDVGTYDDWAWAPVREGRASDLISDHCAGVAIDLNATKEGSQGSGSLKFWRNPVVVSKLRLLRRKYRLLEWGGDYKNFRDPMHWVFKYGTSVDVIERAMVKLGINKNGVISAK